MKNRSNMSSNDELYKIIIDYIQEDNRWKEAMNKTVASIEIQTKLTNGRLNKLEPIVEKLDTANDKSISSITAQKAVKALNWKWITGLGTVAMFVINFTVRFIYDAISNWLNR